MFVSKTDYLATLPAFGAFFLASLLLLAIFVVLYSLSTPHRELRLIREGNLAAAISLSGAVIGFVLPLASAIQNSINLVDATVWGIVALVVQIVAFLVLRLAVPTLVRQIEAGDLAPAVIVATMSVAIGVLNAACVTY